MVAHGRTHGRTLRVPFDALEKTRSLRSLAKIYENLTDKQTNRQTDKRMYTTVLYSVLVPGHYVYIETSLPRIGGDFADFYSPLMSPPPRPGGTSLTCHVRFCYHMLGITVGDLSVFIENADGQTPIWQVHGEQGDRWLCDRVAINQYIQNIDYRVNNSAF